MEIPWDIIAILISFGLGFLISRYGEKWKLVKNLLNAIVKALEDDKLTKEELEKIIEAVDKLMGD